MSPALMCLLGGDERGERATNSMPTAVSGPIRVYFLRPGFFLKIPIRLAFGERDITVWLGLSPLSHSQPCCVIRTVNPVNRHNKWARSHLRHSFCNPNSTASRRSGGSCGWCPWTTLATALHGVAT